MRIGVLAVLVLAALSLSSAALAASDIVETAKAAGQFNTLLKAVEAAGLVETLKGKGPFTVFAPTDEAFAKLPKETLDNLLKPENKEKLKEILLYHVVQGTVVPCQAVIAAEVLTVGGKKLTLKTQGDRLMAGDAEIVKVNVQASNGLIHVIDTVLIPE